MTCEIKLLMTEKNMCAGLIKKNNFIFNFNNFSGQNKNKDNIFFYNIPNGTKILQRLNMKHQLVATMLKENKKFLLLANVIVAVLNYSKFILAFYKKVIQFLD